jgi:hypothetical protein
MDVACELSYTLTKQPSARLVINQSFQAFTPAGQESGNIHVSLAGNPYSGDPQINTLNEVPIKVTVYLTSPGGTRQLRVLTALGQRFDNVPVAPGNAPSPRLPQLPYARCSHASAQRWGAHRLPDAPDQL